MNRNPETTVVITCFNYGHFLEGCLGSVLEQTYKDFEIIVIDDGSTDNTPQVMDRFSALPNLRYVRQENAGQARAKNRGIESARGGFIAFLDADDRWCPEKLEKQMACFKRNEVGVVYCRAKYLDGDNVEFPYEMTGPYLQPRRGKVTEWLVFDNFVQFSSSIVRKACFEKFGKFDETLKMGIDWDLWLRISTGYEFDYMDERLFFYRIGHSGQMSRNVEVRMQCSDRIMESFFEKFPGVVSPQAIKKAYYLTFCNRGSYFGAIDNKKSYGFFLQAIRKMPCETQAYKGIVKNLLGLNSGISNNIHKDGKDPTSLSGYLYLAGSDLYRYSATKSVSTFFKTYFLVPGFKYSFWMRTCRFLKGKPYLLPFYALARFRLRRLQYKYGIFIPYNTRIGSGFYIGHPGGIIVNPEAIIGKNCNINQGVTIGITYGGKHPGTPVIGDNVYIGPGSFIIGGIEIDNHVAIGANTVVNKPIPAHAVVVSPPGEVISHKGSGSYIVNTDY